MKRHIARLLGTITFQMQIFLSDKRIKRDAC